MGRTVAVLILLFFVVPLRADAEPADLTLEQAVIRALSADPALQALAARADRLKRAARLAGAPSPLSLRLSAVAGSAGEDANQLSQSFETGGQPGLRLHVAHQDQRGAEAQIALRRADVAAAVTRSAVRLSGAERALDVALQEEQAQQSLLDVARRRLAAGDVAQVDVARAERERARATRGVASARRALDMVRADLAVLLGIAPHRIEATSPSVPTLAIPAMLAEAARRRPELEAARAAVAAREANAGIVAAQRAPTVSLGLFQSRFYGQDQTRGAAVSVSWPLLDWGSVRREVEAARAETAAARVDLARAERDVAREVAESAERHAGLARELEALRAGELDAARRALAMLERGYAAGLLNQLEVIEAHRTLRDLLQEEIRLATERDVAGWDLLRGLGRPLPGTGGSHVQP